MSLLWVDHTRDFSWFDKYYGRIYWFKDILKMTYFRPSNYQPYIHLILGPMFAEKSTNLLRASRRLTIAKLKCLLIKYQGDQRYTTTNHIATHDRVHSEQEAYSCTRLNDLYTNYPNLDINQYDVICIDEVQFYPDSLDFCLGWRSRGKFIIACGLYADFQRVPFRNVPELMAHADQIEFLKAICHDCSQDSATTSYRLTKEVEQVSIGGADKYHPLCQICYEKRHSKSE